MSAIEALQARQRELDEAVRVEELVRAQAVLKVEVARARADECRAVLAIVIADLPAERALAEVDRRPRRRNVREAVYRAIVGAERSGISIDEIQKAVESGGPVKASGIAKAIARFIERGEIAEIAGVFYAPPALRRHGPMVQSRPALAWRCHEAARLPIMWQGGVVAHL